MGYVQFKFQGAAVMVRTYAEVFLRIAKPLLNVDRIEVSRAWLARSGRRSCTRPASAPRTLARAARRSGARTFATSSSSTSVLATRWLALFSDVFTTFVEKRKCKSIGSTLM